MKPHGVQLHEGEVRWNGGQGREVERVERRGEDGLENGGGNAGHDEGAEAVEDGAPASEGPDEGVDAAEGGRYGELAGGLGGRLASLLGVVVGEGEGLVGGRSVVVLDDGERGVERAEGVSDLGGQRLALAGERGSCRSGTDGTAMTYEDQNREEEDALESDERPNPLAQRRGSLVAPLDAPLQQGRRPVDNVIQHHSRSRLKGRRESKGQMKRARYREEKRMKLKENALRKGWKD